MKPKCTDKLIEEAVRLKKNGMNNKDMAAMLGIGETTFYRWLLDDGNEQHRKFRESLENAEAEFFAALRSKVMAHTDDSWQAAAWMLERLRPDEYGRRERHEVVAEVESRHVIQDASASPEALEKAEELLTLLYGDGR